MKQCDSYNIVNNIGDRKMRTVRNEESKIITVMVMRLMRSGMTISLESENVK